MSRHSYREEYTDHGHRVEHNVWVECHHHHDDHRDRQHGVDALSHTQKIAQELALQVIERAQLDPASTRVQDFAFDTSGFYASRVLQPHGKSLAGVGVDADAVDAYNTHANQANLGPETMGAVRVAHMGDLAHLAGYSFDVIMCAQPVEQRPDIANVLPQLANALNPGGLLFLVSLDLSSRAGMKYLHNDGRVDAEHERIRGLFTAAGLVTADVVQVRTYGFAQNEPGKLFVAKAVKPPDVDAEGEGKK